MIKAAILDFDGTLVTEDILDVLCGIVGKETESKNINTEFHSGKRNGLSALVERINFLQGVTFIQIEQKLNENPYLMNGARELLQYLKDKNIVTILSSGNITPVLKYYQQVLGFSYIVGSNPKMERGIILSITEEDCCGVDRKLSEARKILDALQISGQQTLAIGDSPADKKIFEFVKFRIAINPKGDIAQYSDAIIHDDLLQAIPIIESMHND